LALDQFYVEGEEQSRVRSVEDAAAGLGLVPIWAQAAVEVPEVYLWPENVAVWRLFQACNTQWKSGLAGPTGLDYPAVETVLRIRRVKKADLLSVFSMIQVMERSMLSAWSEKRNG